MRKKGNKTIRKIKALFWKLARSRDSKEEIARGAAIGTFISVFPTFGLGTLLVIIMSRVLKFNMLIALATSVISNPFTGPFFLLSSYQVGSFILDKHITFDLKNWEQNLAETGLTVFVGSLIVSGTMAIIAYYISIFMVDRYRNRNKR
jgi:uncharacterized protein (DUF2062 family)